MVRLMSHAMIAKLILCIRAIRPIHSASLSSPQPYKNNSLTLPSTKLFYYRIHRTFGGDFKKFDFNNVRHHYSYSNVHYEYLYTQYYAKLNVLRF